MTIRGNEKAGICGICPAGCGVIVTYDAAGRMAAVRADDTSPFGMICRVGLESPAIVYSPDRILSPMRRRGAKGTYDFHRISWDDAYDEIASNLQRIKAESGPEAVAVYTGSGSFDRALCDVFQPAGVAVSSASSVLFPFGSPNTLGVGALCYVAFAMIAPHVTMGSMYIDMFSDIDKANLIVVWGKNPAAHCPPDDFNRITAALSRGAKAVVIEPRRTALARLDGVEWLPVRPGTDGALALALCNTLIEEDLYAEGFARHWMAGFDDFRGYARHFRPEQVEGITGVPAGQIRSLARRMADTGGVAPVMYSGLEYNGNGVQTVRSVLTLWALAGQLDVPGGLCFRMRGNRFPLYRGGLIENPDVRKAAGHNSFPLYTRYRGEFHASALPKAVLRKEPYPIRALVSLGASIVTSWPRSVLWRETLGSLDFLVSVDRQWTADMAYADLLLPASTYYEAESYMVYESAFRIRERLLEPLGEARYDFFILAELARRLGYGHLYPQTSEELLSHVLRDSGFTPDRVRIAGGTVHITPALMQYRKWEKGLLRMDGQPGFQTPSGTFEVSSSILEDYGYDPLPRYVEPSESPASQPELARRFPLVFNSGARRNTDLHALHQSIPSLSREYPVPTVMINCEDASRRGIEDGGRVTVSTPRGAIEVFALVTPDIVRGAVEVSGAGGGAVGADEWREACANDLTDLDNFDPVSGFPAYKALLCEVTRTGKAGRITGGSLGEYRADITTAQTPPPKPVYLDHNATTAPYPDVIDAMVQSLYRYGNPSGIYSLGREALRAIEESRRSLALLLNAVPRRMVFTSGGSEGNSFVIKGMAFAASPERNHVVTSSTEHASVLGACQWLEGLGFSVTYLPVDRYGLVDPRDLEEALTERTFLVTIMAANNETGSIQPIAELAKAAKTRGIPFHTDAVQAVGKIPVDVEEWGVDLLTLSAHKFGGPKGAGAVYIRKGLYLPYPLIHGGKQERGLRGGTENVLSIVGMGQAARTAQERFGEMESRIKPMRDSLQRAIAAMKPGVRLNGHLEKRLPNTLNLMIPGVRGESLVLALDGKGVFFSSGSACKSGSPEPSHVLLAMGLSPEEAHCSVRFTLGMDNTEEDMARTAHLLSETIKVAGEEIRFVSCR